MTDLHPTRTSDGADAPLDESPRTLRLRYPRTALVPLIVGAVCALPVAIGLGPWGLLLALPFLIGAYAVHRIGADITGSSVVVHGTLGSATVDRDALVGFTVPDAKHVHLVRQDGSTVRIPTARPRDLPRLRAILFPQLADDDGVSGG